MSKAFNTAASPSFRRMSLCHPYTKLSCFAVILTTFFGYASKFFLEQLILQKKQKGILPMILKGLIQTKGRNVASFIPIRGIQNIRLR